MSEPEPFDYNEFAFNLIVGLRGGLPEQCDFCGLGFGICVSHSDGTIRIEDVYCTPEEAIENQQHIEYECGESSWITVRYPIPEEAGEWTCNECLARWQAEGAPGYRREG